MRRQGAAGRADLVALPEIRHRVSRRRANRDPGGARRQRIMAPFATGAAMTQATKNNLLHFSISENNPSLTCSIKAIHDYLHSIFDYACSKR
jgi:hypothetical protein